MPKKNRSTGTSGYGGPGVDTSLIHREKISANKDPYTGEACEVMSGSKSRKPRTPKTQENNKRRGGRKEEKGRK